MDWDDEYDNGHAQVNNASHRDESGLDPMDMVNPASAYFFLSRDVQDEIWWMGDGDEKMRTIEGRW